MMTSFQGRFRKAFILLLSMWLLLSSGSLADRALLGFEANQDAASALAEVGGQTIKVYPHTRMMLVEVPEGQLDKLKKKKGIRFAEADAVTRKFDTVTWNVEAIGAPLAWQVTQGGAIKVAVLDTGIDVQHDDIHVYGGYTAEGIFGDPLADYDGHGTMVAGVIAALNNNAGIYGVAPQAALYSVKVLDDSGSGTVSALIDGIYWAINNGIHIVNMSLGTKTDSQALRETVEAAYDAGLLLVAAAGNTGNKPGNNDCVQYPAAYAPVIAVGAVDKSDVRASFSATGPSLDIVAPGVGVISAWPSTLVIATNGYATASGTSMAAPHVTGTAALIWAKNRHWSNSQVQEHLLLTAKTVGDGNANRYGRGRVDAAAALGIGGDAAIPETMAATVNTVFANKNKVEITVTVQAAAGGSGQSGGATITTPLSGAVISLTVYTPAGTNYNVKGYTDKNGRALFTWHVRNKDGMGVYQVRAQVSKAGYIDAVTTGHFTVYN